MRRGAETPILGVRELRMAAYYNDSITLFETPEAWLLGGAAGVCVLDWGAPIDGLFEGVGTVECGSPELHQRLMKALRRREPRVVVRQGGHHAK